MASTSRGSTAAGVQSDDQEGLSFDRPVVVVGAGAAGLVAAIRAHDLGADVVVLEKGGPSDVGGNAHFSGGLFLFAHGGADDIRALTDLGGAQVEIAPYTTEMFEDAVMKMSGGRADRRLVSALAADSLEGMKWLAGIGVKFQLASPVFGTFRRADVITIPLGAALQTVRAGAGYVDDLVAEVERRNIPIRFGCGVSDVVLDGGRLVGLRIGPDHELLACRTAVLTSGGFEASERLRREYLGPEWVDIKVRGSRHNTGEVLEACVAQGVARAGDWSACHSVSVDAFASGPPMPDEPTPTRYSRGFRYGILVDREGRRFFDEGEDAWTRIYSKMGRAILGQPGRVAFHIFDDKVSERVREALPGAEPIVASSIAEAAQAAGIDPSGLEATVATFNKAINDAPLDLDILDGRSTVGIEPAKSNWADTIDTPPYLVYTARCGVTFTHGGIAIDEHGRVQSVDGTPVDGLFAAGEMTGGFFFGNYPGGSSLMRSTVFGLRAAEAAVSRRAELLNADGARS